MSWEELLDGLSSTAYIPFMTPAAALDKAIRLAGGHTKLAELLGIRRTAIYQWKTVPAERAVQIERAVDGEVTREQLRPDLYREAAPTKRRRAAA